MNILVTGGCGYIGSHIVKRLHNEGHRVAVIDNFSNTTSFSRGKVVSQWADIFIADLTLEKHISYISYILGKINAIFHLAALKNVRESINHPDKYHFNNIISTRILLKYFNCPIVYSSSCAVYGNAENCVNENSELKPLSPYANSKLQTEQLLFQECSSNFVILRYFNPIGCEDSKLRDISESCISTALRSGNVKIYGTNLDTPDGTCIRDYIHITDLVDAHIIALAKLLVCPNSINRVYNVGTGNGISVKELCDSYKLYVNKDLVIEDEKHRTGDPIKIWSNTNNFEKDFGFKANHTIKDIVLAIM